MKEGIRRKEGGREEARGGREGTWLKCGVDGGRGWVS